MSNRLNQRKGEKIRAEINNTGNIYNTENQPIQKQCVFFPPKAKLIKLREKTTIDYEPET